MEKRGHGTTSALLQRVSTQLKGERVLAIPKEEDELKAYLNSISKKTTQQTKTVNFSDFGDISISSSDNISTPKQKTPQIGSGSKYLKKKVAETPQPTPKASEEPKLKKSPSHSTGNTSAVLSKATGSAKKSPVHSSLPANQNVFSIDTDTEDSDSHNIVNLQESFSEQSIGHDGRRFIMKRPETPKVPTMDVFTKSRQKKDDHSPERSIASKKVKKMNKTNTVSKKSEAENLADFMQRLSSSDSTPRPRSTNYHQRPADGAPPKPRSPSPESKPYRVSSSPRSPRKTPSPLIGRRTPSPLALHRSQDSDMIDSIVSEVVETQETASSDDMFKGVMDIEALGLVLPEENESQPSRSKSKKNTSKIKKLSLKKKKDKPTKVKKSIESDIFSSYGLQSVEDLMGRISDDDESIPSEISEIRFERRDNSTRIPRKESLSEIQTFGASVSPGKHGSLSQADSISERIGISSQRDKSSIMFEVRTQYSEDTIGEYSDEFDSGTEGDTEIDSDRPRKPEPIRHVHHDEKSYSDSYTSYTDSKTYDKRTATSPQKQKPKTKSIQVQTEKEPGLSYSLKTPMAVLGPNHGLNFVDPTPIATHVVNVEALEAMAAYSPAMIALHDMLKQQLMLTQSFLAAQERIYKNYSSSLVSNYHYTTLEDTKAYIKKHRKPPITFKQALKLVSAEMDH